MRHLPTVEKQVQVLEWRMLPDTNTGVISLSQVSLSPDFFKVSALWLSLWKENIKYFGWTCYVRAQLYIKTITTGLPLVFSTDQTVNSRQCESDTQTISFIFHETMPWENPNQSCCCLVTDVSEASVCTTFHHVAHCGLIFMWDWGEDWVKRSESDVVRRMWSSVYETNCIRQMRPILVTWQLIYSVKSWFWLCFSCHITPSWPLELLRLGM